MLLGTLSQEHATPSRDSLYGKRSQAPPAPGSALRGASSYRAADPRRYKVYGEKRSLAFFPERESLLVERWSSETGSPRRLSLVRLSLAQISILTIESLENIWVKRSPFTLRHSDLSIYYIQFCCRYNLFFTQDQSSLLFSKLIV